MSLVGVRSFGPVRTAI